MKQSVFFFFQGFNQTSGKNKSSIVEVLVIEGFIGISDIRSDHCIVEDDSVVFFLDWFIHAVPQVHYFIDMSHIMELMGIHHDAALRNLHFEQVNSGNS